MCPISNELKDILMQFQIALRTRQTIAMPDGRQHYQTGISNAR